MTVLLIGSCLTPVLFILVQKVKGGPLATVFKTLASVFFVSLGLCALSKGSGQNAGFLVILGLVLGLCGDVLLDVGFEADGTPNERVLGGIAAFALEHVAVVTAVSMAAGFDLVRFLVALAIGLAVGLGVCFGEKCLLHFCFGSLFVPACAYAVFLSTAMSYYILVTAGNTAFFPVAVGMGAFLLSDLILSAIYFGDKNTHSWVAVNLLTYYVGQILIALSVQSVF